MRKYNLKQIMHTAWKFFRKGAQSFAVALRMAAAGITEDTHTWSGWKSLGYEVIHESKALYKVVIADPATKSGNRIACYFGFSQVQI